jgi:hypothetical protein
MIRGVLFGFLVSAIAAPDGFWLHVRALARLQSTKCAPQFVPLHTGASSGTSDLPMWSREQAEPWRGVGWLGWKRDGQLLERVELMIRDVPAPIEDYAELTVESVPKVDFAVRCVPGLDEGRIQSVLAEQTDLVYDGPLSLSLGGRQYHISVRSSDKSLADARVVLMQGKLSQTLYSVEGFADDPHYSVVWAGDLDQDAKLDLVLNLNRKYSWNPYRLLLSTRADARQLVGDAALFVSSC